MNSLEISEGQISHVRLSSNKYGRPLFLSHYLENQYGTVSSLFLSSAATQEVFSIFPRCFLKKLLLSPYDLIKNKFVKHLKLKLRKLLRLL